MNEVIHVLIADDHELVREGMRALLDPKPEVEVVGEAANGQEVVELATSLKPDVILMDLVMPRKDGIEAIQDIKAGDPDARILVITSFSDDDKTGRSRLAHWATCSKTLRLRSLCVPSKMCSWSDVAPPGHRVEADQRDEPPLCPAAH